MRNIISRTAFAVLVASACAGRVADPGPVISGRTNAGAAFDAARGHVLVFGGQSGGRELWSWNGTRWSLLSSAGPGARDDGVMTFDAGRGRIVLVGGRAGAGPSAIALADTWEWDGQQWTNRPVASAGARLHAAGAFDVARGVTVLFGGVGTADRLLADTWEWNGASWTQRDSAGPASSAPNGMVYDPVRQRVQLLVSDLSAPLGNGRFVSRLWEWDGQAWTQRAGTPPPLSPVQRIVQAGPGGGVLLFDGDPPTGAVAETWRYDGATWTKLGGASPPRRFGGALVYDAARNVAVLFGGHTNAQTLADTWELSGDTWTQRP